MHWRATRIRDRDCDITIIPNNQAAKACVTNHCRPEKTHPTSILVDFETDLSVEAAKA
jgi:small-conductance mechanosensitive channel